MSEPESTTEPPYQQLGGEAGVRALVDRFYDLMDSLPQAATIRAMHARSLKASRQKLFEYLSGWLGGPDLYVQKYGHPRLRRRHLPFAVDTAAAQAWMLCMDRALEETVADAGLRTFLHERFAHLADFMRNQPE